MNGLPLWRRQILTIVSLEWKKTLFGRRGAWVYFLAFFPAFLFGMAAFNSRNQRANQEKIAVAAPAAAAVVSNSVQMGMAADDLSRVLESNKVPFQRFTRGRGNKREFIQFNDGQKAWRFRFDEGKLVERIDRSEASMNEQIRAFAGVFQYFFLRLAIFFGCVGVFMNLFRGEMLDQSLHHYLLAPVRREVLMVGKYLAGLLATILIFGSSVALQFFFLVWGQSPQESSNYLATIGWGHLFTYLGVTALACVGYGSLFLAAGLIMRNPLIAASLILFWEGINWFLPAALKQLSVIYYLQALCPVVAPINADIPEALKLLVTTAAPIPAPLAVLGIFVVAAAVLAIASTYVRKLEINYGAD